MYKDHRVGSSDSSYSDATLTDLANEFHDYCSA